MNFITETWHYLINLLIACLPAEEPIFSNRRPEPNLFMNRIDQNHQNHQINPSESEDLSINNKVPLDNQSINQISSAQRLQIPAFEPIDICPNSNLLISGSKVTGKTTLAQNIIREQYLDSVENSETRILVFTNDFQEMCDWSEKLGTPVTQINNLNTHNIVQTVKNLMDTYHISQELNETQGQAVVVFDETFTRELGNYHVIYNLLQEHKINVIIINQRLDYLAKLYHSQIDYYLLAGFQLSKNLTYHHFKIPETIVKFFEFSPMGRFLTIDKTMNQSGEYGWIDTEVE